MSSESRERIEDKEKWLASMAEEQDGVTRPQLLATAALLRGVAKGISIPDDAEEHSRQRMLATWEEIRRPQRSLSPRPWFPNALGGLLRAVFTLGRRR